MIYILGHSHAINPVHALSALPIAVDHANWIDDIPSPTFEFLSPKAQCGFTEGIRYFIIGLRKGIGASYAPSVDGQRKLTLTKQCIELIQTIENARSTRIICFIQGNEPAAISLIEHDIPYDFVRPGEPQALPGHQILPIAVIRDQLHQASGEFQAMTEALHVLVPQAQLFIMAPPPTIPSSKQIFANPEAFGAALATRKITDASIRLKYYREYCALMQRHCALLGARFVPAPPETSTPEGFLREEYWLAATHGNMAYADRVLLQLKELCQ